VPVAISSWRRRLRLWGGFDANLPRPGGQVGEPLDGMIGQLGENVGEPGVRVDVFEFACLDRGLDGCGATAARIGASESPVAAAERNAAQGAFGGVARQANPPVVEEARERRPAGQLVADRLGDLVLRRQPLVLRAYIRLERGGAGLRIGLARCAPRLRRLTVDAALDGEQLVDAAHDLGGDRRLGQFRQVEEVAPSVRPARGFEDRRGLAVLGVEGVVA